MHGLEPISGQALKLAQHLKEGLLGPESITAEHLANFSMSEVQLVIREALRLRLTSIGKIPSRGERITNLELLALNDEVITSLILLDSRLGNRPRKSE